jgi:predicted secreted protein
MPYNTVPFHGKVSQVEKNNVAMDFGLGWNLNVALDMAEANRAAQNWKEALPGQAGWNGDFSGQFVAGNTEQKAFLDNLIIAAPGTKLTDVKFLLDGATNAFTGNVFITAFSISPAINGVVSFKMNFQGDGALTLTNAA